MGRLESLFSALVVALVWFAILIFIIMPASRAAIPRKHPRVWTVEFKHKGEAFYVYLPEVYGPDAAFRVGSMKCFQHLVKKYPKLDEDATREIVDTCANPTKILRGDQ